MMLTRSKSISTVFFVACLLLSAKTLKGQDNYFNEPTFQAPNAASLGEYADVPIGYHTGVANISVPIYTVTEGDLSLPISLSYHSGGIRVDEMSSWVGLGWSLNAGGIISRSVQGGLDEGNTKSNWVSGRAGWGWYKDYGAPPEIVDPTNTCYNPGAYDVNINDFHPTGGNTPQGCWFYHRDAATGRADTEPDIFSFNVGGYSGKFFFNSNRQAVLIPEQDIKIEVNYDEPNLKFQSWTITLPNGIKYYFGRTAIPTDVDPIENNYSNQYGWPSANENDYSTSSWLLNRIESANGRHWIELEYEAETYGFANRLSHSCQTDIDQAIVPGGDCTTAPTQRMKNRVEGVRLSRIITSSGRSEVQFNISDDVNDRRQDVSEENIPNTSYPLKSIVIDDTGICRKFELSTSYFASDPNSIHSSAGYDDSDIYRLKLDAVQESSCDGSVVIPAYQFTYNNTQMCRRYSLARDHWGFYNGVDSQEGLIPDETVTVTLWNTYDSSVPPWVGVPYPVSSEGGADRNANAASMKAWILEKVKYPTGGYSSFTYEPHTQGADIVGGLRVTQVAEYDRDNVLLKKKNISYGVGFLYTRAGGYGVDLQKDGPYLSLFTWYWHFGALFNSTPNTALRHSNGYHIAYNSATLNFLDGSTRTYTYKNDPPSFLFNEMFPYSLPIQKVGNGSELSEIVKENATDEIQRIDRTYDDQQFVTDESIVKLAPTTGYRRDPDSDPSFPVIEPQSFSFKNIYQIRSSAYRLQSVTETKDGFTNTTNYAYGNNHQQPLEQTTTNSLGEVVKVEYAYPPDLSTTQAVALSNRNQINLPLEVDNYVDNNLISSTRLNYDISGTTINMAHVDQYPDGINRIRTSVTFDENDNLASIQKEYDIPVTYHWEGPQKVSVGVFQGASPDQVYYTSFEESSDVNVTDYSQAKTGVYYFEGDTYTLNSTEVPAHGAGMMISYYYFEDGQWQRREKTYDSYTISEPGASRYDEIRIHPAGVLVSSHQLGYGGQVISSSDENGNTLTYTLDQLGRLFNVKDNQGFIQQQIEYNYANQN